MGFRLTYSDLQEVLFEQTELPSIGEGEFYRKNTYHFHHKQLKGQYTEVVLENLKIGYGNSAFASKTQIDFEFSGETVEMHFNLGGISTTLIDGLANSQQFNGNCHNLFYGRELRGNLFWESRNMMLFEVNIHPVFFRNYLPLKPIFKTFKQCMLSGEPCYFTPHNYPILPQMKRVIQEIIHCQREGVFKKMFLESKVLELLLLQFEQIQQQKPGGSEKLQKRQLETMHQAKEIINANLNNPLSLQELAKQLNTNECTLKKGFKAVFGHTVFGYIQELKMDRAKTLILDQNIPLYQVADSVGYKNPHHFTAAFKKHFGYVPSKLQG